jgi:hypothetical protein
MWTNPADRSFRVGWFRAREPDAMGQALGVESEADGVGFWCSETSEAIAQAEDPEDGGVGGEADGGVTALDAADGGE